MIERVRARERKGKFVKCEVARSYYYAPGKAYEKRMAVSEAELEERNVKRVLPDPDQKRDENVLSFRRPLRNPSIA